MEEYFIFENGKQQGPFSLDDILGMKVSKDTHVWKKGLTDWVLLGDLPEYIGLSLQQALTSSNEEQTVAHQENEGESSYFENGASVNQALIEEPFGPEIVPEWMVQDEEGVEIIDRQPLWMRPVSGTLGRLNAPVTSLVLGITAPFKPGPTRSDDSVQQVAEGFTHGNADDRLELQLGSSMPFRNLKRIWKSKGLSIISKLLGTLVWPTSEITRACGRLDCYDPFAHSIALYHNDSAILTHELGHAQDFAARKMKLLYICARAIPLVLLYQEWKASSFGINNLRQRGLEDKINRTNRVLGAGFGSYIGSFFKGVGMIPGALIGHAIGIMFKPFGKRA